MFERLYLCAKNMCDVVVPLVGVRAREALIFNPMQFRNMEFVKKARL